MRIERYDERLHTGPGFTGEPYEQVAFRRMVEVGRVRPGDRRKIDVSLVESVLETIESGRGHGPAILDRLQKQLGPAGTAEMTPDLVARVAEIDTALLCCEICGPYADELAPLDKGCCLACMGRLDEATVVFGEAIEDGDADPRFFLCRGRVRLLKKEMPLAILDLDRFLSGVNPFRRASALAWRAEALMAEGRALEAVSSVETALEVLAALPQRCPDWADLEPRSGLDCWLGYHPHPKECAEPPPEPETLWIVVDLREVIGAARLLEACQDMPEECRDRAEEIEARILAFRDKILI
jgi:hypothetical protein